jgi:hypothetical protein
MRVCARGALLGGFVALIACEWNEAWGQGRPTAEEVSPEAEEGVPSEVRKAAERIQYVGPDTYLLLDAEGRPQPVPGMTYEDFLEAWKRNQLVARAGGARRYMIEKVAMVGHARENFAELDFTVTVHLLSEGEIDVPLGLVGALLSGEPKFALLDNDHREVNERSSEPTLPRTEAIDGYLAHDTDEGGFVARLSGRKGERHQVSLKLIVPLLRDGGETTFQLSCPKAVASELTLKTNGPAAQFAVMNGTLVEQQPVAGQDSTRVRIAGPQGPFRLTWQSGEEGSSEFTTVLSAAGEIHISIDGRSVRSDAALTVQSFGRGFDRFRVRLPAGAQLIPGRGAETSGASVKYRVVMDPVGSNAPPNGDQGDRAVVMVQFEEEQQAPVTIQLSTERPIGLETDAPVELTGFEVLGAVRQYGDIALDVAGDWQARWEVGRNVRQVEAPELAPAVQASARTAAFQYDGQPWSLGMRVAARQSRVQVTPRFEVQLLPDEARLALRLNYQVSGARVFEFRLRLEGWELVSGSLESAGLVDQARIFVGERTLVLPLAQASTPRAEVSLSLRRPLAAAQQRVELPLPVPIANSVGAGDILIRPSNGFELRADMQNSRGLVPAPAIEAADERVGGNGSELRFRSTLPAAVLVTDRVQRSREVYVEGNNRVEIGEDDAVIEQRLAYEVVYEPLEVLVLQTPLDLPLEDGRVEAMLLRASVDGGGTETAGTPLRVIEATDVIDSDEGLIAKRLRLALPTPQIDKFIVALRYAWPRPATTGTSNWDLPLVTPDDGRVTNWTAEVQGPRDTAITLNSKSSRSSWAPARAAIQGARSRSSYEFSAERAERALPLVLSRMDLSPTAATTIDRVWLQTWFAGDMRQDRSAFRFRTAALQAAVELPPGAAEKEIEVLVDGKPAQRVSQAPGRIVVRLERSFDRAGPRAERDGEEETQHTLELRTRESINTALITRHRLTPPQLLGNASLSHVYWQVVLPGDHHVVRSPARMTSSGEWQWLGSFWGRRPRLAQNELEAWADASEQMAPAAEQNQYLYMGLAKPLSIEIITAPRWLIVLVTSSVVLAIGLAWLYLPVAHRHWVWVAFACVLAALAVAFPVPAILLGQASVLGAIAALAAMTLRRFVRRPALIPISVSAGSSRYSPPPRGESVSMPPVVATGSTAPTATIRVPESER